MAALMRAVHDGGSVTEVNGRDNLATMALVEACYRSLERHAAVPMEEIATG
jgi:predicted dehydrogenase